MRTTSLLASPGGPLLLLLAWALPALAQPTVTDLLLHQMLDEMGFVQTRLRRKTIDRTAVERGWENISTPNEMARIAAALWRGEVIDAAASRDMLTILKKVKGPIRAALPPEIETATKTGAVPGVNCESGVILLPGRPFALSVMSTFNPPGTQPITDVTRLVYEAFDKLARANTWGHRLREAAPATPPPPATRPSPAR